MPLKEPIMKATIAAHSSFSSTESSLSKPEHLAETEIMNTNSFAKLKFGEKVVFLRNYITVEPMLACYIMPSVLSGLAVQNMNLQKACRVNLGYSDEVS